MKDNLTIEEQIKYIRRTFHAMMNGVVASSMRNKGIDYKINFGVELPRLEDFSKELPHNAKLATELWKANSRECRLLATMVMPANEYAQDMAELWMEQVKQYEEADVWVYYLLATQSYASNIAFRWIADERKLYRYTGYALLSRLMTDGKKLSERDANELLDHCNTELSNTDPILRKAAYKTIRKYMRLGREEEIKGEKIIGF